MQTGRPLVEIKDLTMAYDDFVIQRDLDFAIERGEIFVVMGISGSGKTTLLRHLVGLKSPAKGEILYAGENFWSAGPERRQQMRDRFRDMTPEQRQRVRDRLRDRSRQQRDTTKQHRRPTDGR